MEQVNIDIGGVKVPVIIDENVKYYPISYITTKLLLRTNKNGLIHSKNKDVYKENIKIFMVDFGENNLQKCRCLSEDGLKLVLGKTQVARLSVEQRTMQNYLHELLGLNLLTVREIIKDTLSEDELNEHDPYSRDLILSISQDKNVVFQLCNKCHKYHPMTNTFYMIDNRNVNGFGKRCRICLGHIKEFTHPDNTANYLIKNGGMKLYDAYKEDSVIPIYKALLEGKINRLPKCYQNKESYLRIIDYLIDIDKLNEYKINIKMINKKYKLNFYKYLSLHEVYAHLHGRDFYLYPWKYENYHFRDVELTYELASIILNNFTNEFNIVIDDIFDYDYVNLTKQAKINSLAGKDMLYFLVQYYSFQYPGYMFKVNAVNYYKNENNVKHDLKYLIEKDMKLDIDKIPLYLTKNTLNKKCSPLYHWIVTKKNGSIYEWVNKLYPDKFIAADFEINPYRNEFDSDTEFFIDEILRDKFNNVIYNQRNTDRTITIGDKVPDWFVFTDNGVWVIEYFGMYETRYTQNNRISAYIEKTEKKIEEYEKLKGYNFIYVYRDDIEDNFKGFREKIEKIR